MDILGSVKKESSLRSQIIATSQGFRRRFASTELIMAVLMLLVFGVELFMLYTYLYKNIILEDTTATASQSAAVRINFDNYKTVIKHLDGVSSYHPSPDIDFKGATDSIGRQNPFADPQ